ncbi:MAG: flagellar basal body P-ring formation protein FlgA, partial [Phycisphaeraceae bacterium]|nr:flagellar basal body P-ring formation protein FlgA [Phycisphaeraceae bacterium]
MKNSEKQVVFCGWALLAAGLLAWAGAARADRIELRARAQSVTTTVTLGDVAVLEGERAQAMAATPVGWISPSAPGPLKLELTTVQQMLEKQGVHWGLLTLAGHAVCEVTLAEPSAPTTQPTAETAEGLAANPADVIEASAPRTVREQLDQQIASLAGVGVESLRIRWTNAKAEILTRPVMGDVYEFEPLAQGVPGRLPIMVRRLVNGQVVESQRLLADVEKRCLAVVATRRIERQAVISPAAVEIREVYLTGSSGTPLTDLRDVIGQTSMTALRPGDVLTEGHVLSPVLVRRGQEVTVRGTAGGLSIRLVGVALEDGEKGQVIRVRNTSSRETFWARVTERRAAQALLNG